MAYVIRAYLPTTDAGDEPMLVYLRECDVDAHGGLGHADFTGKLADAMRFDTQIDAFEYWRRPSTVRPVREDGRPNRPLTAFTISVLPESDA